MKLTRTSLSPPPDGGGQRAPDEDPAAEDEMLSTPCKRHKRSPQPTDSLGAAPTQGEPAGGSPEVSCRGGGCQAEQGGEPGTPTAGGAGRPAMPPPPPRAPHARRPGLVYASAPTPGGSVATPAAEVPAPPAQLPLPGAPDCYLMPKAPVQRQLFAAAAAGAEGAVGAASVPAQPTAVQQAATQAFLSAMEDQVFLDFTAAFGAAHAPL